MKYGINKDDWLEEAAYCEKSGNPLTCVAIVRAIILHDINDTSDRERILIEEAKHMIDGTFIATARAIYHYGIDVLAPENAHIIQMTINFETDIGKDKANLDRLLKTATNEHPTFESFWLQLIKFHWHTLRKRFET